MTGKKEWHMGHGPFFIHELFLSFRPSPFHSLLLSRSEKSVNPLRYYSGVILDGPKSKEYTLKNWKKEWNSCPMLVISNMEGCERTNNNCFIR